jgi:uncharacterized protein YprB with RNaseH-like and TPR domain
MEYRAYLDIETSGLSPFTSDLTVIGIYVENGNIDWMTQLVGDDISLSKLIQAMDNVTSLYTYNGSRFDLPFIKTKLHIDLKKYCCHKDLMYACWKKNLRGGLKSVERQLGIVRALPDVDGFMAVQLWNRYKHYGDSNSLEILLKYNEEDVMNLKVLRGILNDSD